jgi:hypothetical protein
LRSTHVTDLEIEQFHGRRLPAADLVVFADHTAACADCRRRLQVNGHVGAAGAALERELEGDVDHLSELEVQACVDRTLDPVRLHDIERHLAVCPSCAAEIHDLQEFVAASRPVHRVRWPVFAGLAAAAALVAAIAIATIVRPGDSDRQLVALSDSSGPVIVDDRGGIIGLEGLNETQRQIVAHAVTAGALPVSSIVSGLAGTRGTLLGDADVVAFRLLTPVGTAVLDDRPTLRWTAVAGPVTYIVTLQDQSSGETASSPTLQAAEWTPASPLVRGHRYVWQVAATTGRTEILAPRPPAPPASFAVLDAATASSLEGLPPSHLARGVLYAHAGALDDAERELEALSERNQGLPLADALLKQLRSVRSVP